MLEGDLANTEKSNLGQFLTLSHLKDVTKRIESLLAGKSRGNLNLAEWALLQAAMERRGREHAKGECKWQPGEHYYSPGQGGES